MRRSKRFFKTASSFYLSFERVFALSLAPFLFGTSCPNLKKSFLICFFLGLQRKRRLGKTRLQRLQGAQDVSHFDTCFDCDVIFCAKAVLFKKVENIFFEIIF